MRTLGFLVAAAVVFAQPVAFEVAAIKPAAPPEEVGRISSRMSVDTDAGQLIYTNVTLKDVVRQAYKVQSYQIEAPGWMGTERWDFTATFPPGSSRDQVPLMLQALLAERFGMAMHRETKDLPAYALTVVESKMKPIESSGDNLSTSGSRTGSHVEAKASMRGLTEYLSGRLDRPVLDQTGLSGGFEFTLDWSVDDSADTNGAVAGPSIFTAVQEQLGLKLNATKGPVELIVVDRADRQPTEN
jgi:uncharacterized protein (TIGR03435 family)